MRIPPSAAALLLLAVLPAQTKTSLSVDVARWAQGGLPTDLALRYDGSPHALVVLAVSSWPGATLLPVAPGVGVSLGLDPAGLVAGVVGITNDAGWLVAQMPVPFVPSAHAQAFELPLSLPIRVTGRSPVRELPVIWMGGCSGGKG